MKRHRCSRCKREWPCQAERARALIEKAAGHPIQAVCSLPEEVLCQNCRKG